MLHGGGAAGPRAPPLAQIEVTNGGLTHLAASRKGPQLIVGGAQCLAALELRVNTPRSGEDAAPAFDFCLLRKLRDPRSQQASSLPRSASASAIRKCMGVCYHPELADVAASCSASGHVSLWDLSSGKHEAHWQAHKQPATAVAFLPSPAGPAHAQLVSAASDGSLHLTRLVDLLSAWERPKDLERSSFVSSTSPDPGHVAESPGASAALLSDGRATMAELMSGVDPVMSDLWRLSGRRHPARIHDLDVQADGPKILTAQEGGSVHVFSARDDGKWEPRDFLVSPDFRAVVSGRFHDTSPSLFATACQDDKIVRVFDDREKSVLGEVPPVARLGPCASVGCVRWRPDHPGQLATTGSAAAMSSRGTMGWGILVWDLRKPHTPLHQLNHHANLTPDFLWADANYIIACGKDSSTVQLHSVASSHQPLASVPRGAAAWCVGSGGSESLALLREDVDDSEEDVGSAEGPAEDPVAEDPVGD